MPRKPTNWGLWIKTLLAGGAICVGGPMLTMYLMPSEEELFKQYNPELQKRSLEMRSQAEKDFDGFVNRLKDYSKSDKPIWIVMAEEEKKRKAAEAKQQKSIVEQAKERQEQMRREAGLSATK